MRGKCGKEGKSGRAAGKKVKTGSYFKVLELDIQALVDRQLDPKGERRVRALIASDPSADARYKALLQQKKLLQAWYKKTLTFH